MQTKQSEFPIPAGMPIVTPYMPPQFQNYYNNFRKVFIHLLYTKIRILI